MWLRIAIAALLLSTSLLSGRVLAHGQVTTAGLEPVAPPDGAVHFEERHPIRGMQECQDVRRTVDEAQQPENPTIGFPGDRDGNGNRLQQLALRCRHTNNGAPVRGSFAGARAVLDE
jgi:hypothetical protein